MLGLVARLALAQIFWTRAQKRLAVAACRVIHRERDHRDARVSDALQKFLARIPRARRIDLLPNGTAQLLIDVLHRHRRHSGEHLERAVGFRRPRYRQFPFGKERFLAARRAGENRAVVRRAKKLDVHVHFRRVAQPAGPQLDVPESITIGAQRGIVIHAARHVRPMPRLHLAMSGLLEIEDVQRLRGAPNNLGCGAPVLRQGKAASLQKRAYTAKSGDVRAGS